MLGFVQAPPKSGAVDQLPDLGPMPEIAASGGWINSPALSLSSLKGKVVLVDFWAYSCINCIRTLPHLIDWHNRYKDKGLVLIGVHSPEFDFEKVRGNVVNAVLKYRIPYPVALDSKLITWTIYKNFAWPAHYLIDRNGHIRFIQRGEGHYDEIEEVIGKLLAEEEKSPEKKSKQTKAPEPEKKLVPPLLPQVDFSQIRSPETYLGTLRRIRNIPYNRALKLNEWSMDGPWRSTDDYIELAGPSGKIKMRFSATKVNLIVTPADKNTKAAVRLDGKPVPASKAGKNIVKGELILTYPSLYELINLGPRGEDHEIEIEFNTPGVRIYTFTFG